jgi:hypothetical protein
VAFQFAGYFEQSGIAARSHLPVTPLKAPEEEHVGTATHLPAEVFQADPAGQAYVADD